MNKPKNWNEGFTFPQKLLKGEKPFLKHGRWYLILWDEEEKNQRVYDYSIDMFVPYDSVLMA